MKRLENIKKILIIVDMVNGFVRVGAMADPYIENIIPENERLVEEFLKENEGIAMIKDCHKKDAIEFTKFPVHCVEGTTESEVVDELKKHLKNALVYKKNSTSTIFAPGFLNDIEKMENLEEVVITGCCTDICVMNLAIPLVNYFDQNNKDIKVTIPENAVETYNAPYHDRDLYNDMAFKLMKQAGVNLVKKYEMKRGK